MLSLNERKKLTIAVMSNPHLSAPTTDKIVDNEKTYKFRYQDYIFILKFYPCVG